MNAKMNEMIRALPVHVSEQEATKHADLPHVLLVLDQFPKSLGGGERIALRIAALLPQYGYRPSILTFSVHPESSILKDAPCPVYELPLQRTYDFTALRGALQLRRFLQEHNVSLIQTFFESSDLWAGSIAKTVPGIKLIWSRRDLGILRTRKHLVAYRFMATLPDCVFAVSEQVRQHCIAVDGLDPARVRTIYNGLDISEWSHRTGRTGQHPRPVIATVGNIRRVKGHDILVRAAASLVTQFPDILFTIAGGVLESDYYAELCSLIQISGLESHFEFAGPLDNLEQYLSDADIFVLPSRSEGFSNAIIEAMAASLPVVATAVGGNSEAVEDGVTGIIIPPEDEAALVQAISRLLLAPEAALTMGLAGRMRAAKRFTTEAMMRSITAAYRDLLG